MTFHPEHVPTRSPEIIWHEVDDGSVLVSPTAGKVRVLNRVGRSIWALIDGEQSLGQIENTLTEKFCSIPAATIQKDLHLFLEDLTQRGLLTWGQ